jgi:putative tryptophan/tyrosine transport system substrate-binding protein
MTVSSEQSAVSIGSMEKFMRKRVIGFALSALLLALSLLAEAQQTSKIPRIGILIPGSSAFPTSVRYDSFRQGLRDLGYIEGKNISIEIRYAEGKEDRLSDFAAELVKLKMDVIVTSTVPGVLAAKNATSTIPIVFWAVFDPVRAGLVSSLARPGGNITGLSIVNPELDGKRLELLKETFPKITKVAYLRDARSLVAGLTAMQEAARALGLQLQSLDVRSAKDFDGAFKAVLKERAQALTTSAVPIISMNQQRIVAFAAKNRLPAIYPYSEFIDAGGLMFYGVSFSDLFGRAAVYVDKILKGAKPADLPVEQPTKFEFVINLITANQIGVTIPPNVLARADKVIR